jgi:hypothetical protein
MSVSQLMCGARGKVVELVMQTDSEAIVKVEGNETCLHHGDPKVTNMC